MKVKKNPRLYTALMVGLALQSATAIDAQGSPCPGSAAELTIGEIEFDLDPVMPTMTIYGSNFDNGGTPQVAIGVFGLLLPVLGAGADYIDVDLTGFPDGDYKVVVATGGCKRQVASFDLSLVNSRAGDPTDELITGGTLNGTTLEITDAGGTTSVNLSSLQDDADADPTNELITGGTLNGTTLQITDEGGTTSVNLSSLVDDADANPSNELITGASLTSNTLHITDAGGTTSVNLSSLVNDADASPTNELNLGATLSGTTLQITDAGGTKSVDLSSLGAGGGDTDWTESGGNVFRLSGSVGVGTNAPLSRLHVLNGGILAAGGAGTTPVSGAGSRFMWVGAKRALRAGEVVGTEWDDAQIGLRSVALGEGTRASGQAAVALVSQSTASGSGSLASGLLSVASGNFSTAIGLQVTASGNQSMAFGRFASTNGMTGAFVYGDDSTSSTINSTANNQFSVRASGGTRFFSNPSLTAGVSLAPGAGAWASVSDVNMKENFLLEDGEAVLQKIAEMAIPSWNYKSQDPSIRHLGPMAQDFFEAFQLGNSDTTITTSDIDGINLLAVQALERRTAALHAENLALRAELQTTKSQLQEALDRQVRRTAAMEDELSDLRAQLQTAVANLSATPSQNSPAIPTETGSAAFRPAQMKAATSSAEDVGVPQPLVAPPTGN